jgi:hypothetical protein
MALIKMIKVGDELIFDLTDMAEGVKEISVMMVERAGRNSVLKITADRSIPIKHFKMQTIPSREQ